MTEVLEFLMFDEPAVSHDHWELPTIAVAIYF